MCKWQSGWEKKVLWVGYSYTHMHTHSHALISFPAWVMGGCLPWNALLASLHSGRLLVQPVIDHSKGVERLEKFFLWYLPACVFGSSCKVLPTFGLAIGQSLFQVTLFSQFAVQVERMKNLLCCDSPNSYHTSVEPLHLLRLLSVTVLLPARILIDTRGFLSAESSIHRDQIRDVLGQTQSDQRDGLGER